MPRRSGSVMLLRRRRVCSKCDVMWFDDVGRGVVGHAVMCGTVLYYACVLCFACDLHYFYCALCCVAHFVLLTYACFTGSV